MDRHVLAGEFARRYERKRNMPWFPGAHVQSLEDIMMWLELMEGDSLEVARKLLDNWFGTKWAAKVDYKPRFLAENLGSVYSPPVVPVEDEPNEDAINARRLEARRREEQAELQRKLRGHSEGACTPPPLEDLIGKIGRKV